MDCMRLIVEHDKLQKIKNLQATALDNLFDINRILATKSGRNIELGGQNDPLKKKKKTNIDFRPESKLLFNLFNFFSFFQFKLEV